MGIQSGTNPRSRSGSPWLVALLWLVCLAAARGQATAPLLLPSGLAYDSAGNLFFSETGHHVIRKLSGGGALTIVAGTGVQGYSGDGGPATLARLDCPGALVVDAAGDVVFADTHNHRIRRVDAASGLITTVVGTGVAGKSADGLLASATLVDQPTALALNAGGDLFYADGRRQVVRRVDHSTGFVSTVAGNGLEGALGDGGPALAASFDGPAGLAVDAGGNVFVSDSHNQRVRRIDAGTGLITTVALTGSKLSLPRGLAMDSPGTLYIVDAGNQRIRKIDPVTGSITNLAGDSVEGFAGDGGQATQAELASPRAVTLSGDGRPTVTDAANGRVRQVDAAGVIRTIAGVGAAAAAGLQLAGPANVVYGSGSMTATLLGGSGAVRLLEGSTVIQVANLSGGQATFSTRSLGVGNHVLQATFAGDAGQPAQVSNLLTVMVSPATLIATPNALSVVYGTAIPALSGTLTGVLSQDAGQIAASYNSSAMTLSGAGVYPISVTLAGPAAGNYVVTTVPAEVTVLKAPSAVSLSGTLLGHVSSGTSGQPGGALSLLDGGTAVAVASATATGDVQFSSAGLSNGSHTLSAGYAGDANFLASQSAPVIVTIGPATGADFSIASTGASAVSVPAGSDAVFSFTMTPVNGGLSSPIVLEVTGLPSGATASFSPTYLPPASGPAGFTLTVHTLKTAGLRTVAPFLLGALIVAFWLPCRRRFAACFLLVGLAGCGDRVNPSGQQGGASRTYNLTVTGTATSNAGAALVHSVPITLTLQ